jgi:hypothetical protein
MCRSTLKRFTLLPLFLFVAAAGAQTVSPNQTPTVLKNPTLEQKKSKPTILMVHNGFGTIQAAINSAPVGPVEVYLTCGVYTENVVISSSDVRIHGEERGCVQIQPANPTLPVINIDATNNGTAGMAYDEVSDLSIICPSGASCGDGLKIMGRLDINQINDNHKFSRLGIYGAFQNGINLAGRTILTLFEEIEVENARGNGINVVSNAPTNALTFRNVRSAHNFNYGIYVNNTQVDLANGILFDVVDAEYNGENTSLANCAALSLTGVAQANIQNSYFEGNCLANTADKTFAEVRLTGTYAQSVNIIDSVFNLQYGEGGIYNDAILTTGNYSGNIFKTITNNFTMYIATTHPQSKIVVGVNFNSSPIIVPDGNGMTHVSTLAPFGFDYTAITSVNGNTLDVTLANGIILYYGPYTINNITGGHSGQLLYVTAFDMSGHVLTNAAGGAGQFVFPDGLNRTLHVGESLLLYFDGNNWRPIESAITTQARYTATITTTAVRTDTVAVPGLTSSAHCTYSARNVLASQLTGTFLTTGDGTISLSHAPGNSPFGPYAPAGGIFDVFCSSN